MMCRQVYLLVGALTLGDVETRLSFVKLLVIEIYQNILFDVVLTKILYFIPSKVGLSYLLCFFGDNERVFVLIRDREF